MAFPHKRNRDFKMMQSKSAKNRRGGGRRGKKNYLLTILSTELSEIKKKSGKKFK